MISTVYAKGQSPAGAASPASSPVSMLVPMVVVFGIFYFLILRPQKKKELTHRKFLEGLKKGEEVVTQSGILGRVAGITDQIVTIEVAANVKIKISKAMIAGYPPTSQEAEKQAS